jgi:hypothetical protein
VRLTRVCICMVSVPIVIEPIIMSIATEVIFPSLPSAVLVAIIIIISRMS